jgi:uncharacterized surface protein with fasciclin (FAS1) repeats
LFATSCKDEAATSTTSSTSETPASGAGQSGVQDDQSAKNIVQTAVASKDHSILVTAVKAAGLVDALSNAYLLRYLLQQMQLLKNYQQEP